jgi:hypothetical protein
VTRKLRSEPQYEYVALMIDLLRAQRHRFQSVHKKMAIRSLNETWFHF